MSKLILDTLQFEALSKAIDQSVVYYQGQVIKTECLSIQDNLYYCILTDLQYAFTKQLAKLQTKPMYRIPITLTWMQANVIENCIIPCNNNEWLSKIISDFRSYSRMILTDMQNTLVNN